MGSSTEYTRGFSEQWVNPDSTSSGWVWPVGLQTLPSWWGGARGMLERAREVLSDPRSGMLHGWHFRWFGLQPPESTAFTADLTDHPWSWWRGGDGVSSPDVASPLFLSCRKARDVVNLSIQEDLGWDPGLLLHCLVFPPPQRKVCGFLGNTSGAPKSRWVLRCSSPEGSMQRDMFSWTLKSSGETPPSPGLPPPAVKGTSVGNLPSRCRSKEKACLSLKATELGTTAKNQISRPAQNTRNSIP